jgi:hypothetical protein
MAEDPPLLRVVRGAPTPDELGALVAALLARPGGARPAAPARSAWADRSRLVRAPLTPGPGAWRAAVAPR